MRIFLVQIISRKAILDASARHPEWAASLNAWYKITKAADWEDFEEVRATWKNSDRVSKFIVSDIGHNKCRLAAVIKYGWKMVYIRRVMTHAEYDKIDWKKL